MKASIFKSSESILCIFLFFFHGLNSQNILNSGCSQESLLLSSEKGRHVSSTEMHRRVTETRNCLFSMTMDQLKNKRLKILSGEVYVKLEGNFPRGSW